MIQSSESKKMAQCIGVKKIDIVEKPVEFSINIDKSKCVKYKNPIKAATKLLEERAFNHRPPYQMLNSNTNDMKALLQA